MKKILILTLFVLASCEMGNDLPSEDTDVSLSGAVKAAPMDLEVNEDNRPDSQHFIAKGVSKNLVELNTSESLMPEPNLLWSYSTTDIEGGSLNIWGGSQGTSEGGNTHINYGSGHNYLSLCSGCTHHWRKWNGGSSYSYLAVLKASTGRMGIGTTSPDYKLDVNGTIRGEAIIVEPVSADYVFGKGYDLWSLEEVENFIGENSHLPGIPSALQTDVNGVSLGEAYTNLLQKVEELTLHMIDQNKKIKALQKQY